MPRTRSYIELKNLRRAIITRPATEDVAQVTIIHRKSVELKSLVSVSRQDHEYHPNKDHSENENALISEQTIGATEGQLGDRQLIRRMKGRHPPLGAPHLRRN